MIKNKNIKIVEEDMVLDNRHTKAEKTLLGHKDFEYPLTVSFCSEGKYEVIIKANTAIATKVE